MEREQGNISINSENLLPIIKKWLYSDKDIFVREMISNASDAITKYQRLVAVGEAPKVDNEMPRIDVEVNKKQKTIRFSDNGIGMTAEEVKKYINQIAFSGAMDFIEKYKNKTDADNDIIGHFGLGFYSAFMVSEKVTIESLSFQQNAEAVRWTSTGDGSYEMDSAEKSSRGTDIILHINKESEEFLDEYKIKQVLLKYCSFMPFEIYLTNSEDAKKKKSAPKAENSNEGETEKEEKPEPINDTKPLWLKNPTDCTEEEYKKFYHKVFTDFNDPLFWIHLNMEYPFRLKGILYFPKLRNNYEPNEGQIKLYNNQVYVADNIKEVIPEFLLLLKGTIDCPDMPLNVSRSYLQNDGYVGKISGHITKKVGDKLSALFKNERENYDKYWDDIHPFVKYGCMREEKFYDKVKDILVYKTTKGDHVTLPVYLERNRKTHEDKVFYVTDEKQQAQYIKMFREQEMEAVILDSMIDTHFIQFIEMKNDKVKFLRIDADLSENLKDKDNVTDLDEAKKNRLVDIFKKAAEDEKLEVKIESLKSASSPAIILLSEQSRRMQDMSKFFGGLNAGEDMFPAERTLVLNSGNKLIEKIAELGEDEKNEEEVNLLSRHIYDLALMSHKPLESDAMTKFLERSSLLLERLAERQGDE